MIPPARQHTHTLPDEPGLVMRMTIADPVGGRLQNFHPVETAAGVMFRWSEPVAVIGLRLPRDDYVVRIDTAALRGCTSKIPLQVYWNDQRLADRDVIASGRDLVCRVSRAHGIDGVGQRLMLVVQPLAAAAPDTRELGLPITAVEVFSGDFPAARGGKATAARRIFGRRKTTWQGLAPHLPRWTIAGMRALQAHGPSPAPLSARMPAASSNADQAAGEPRLQAVACDSAIVCPDEINARHGTGLLLQYMFPDLRSMAVLESTSSYGGEHVATAITRKLPSGLGRADVYRCVHEWFEHAPPRRAYVVPFHATDLQMALALLHLFGTRLVLHVMDDNTLVSNGIPESLMEEAIRNSDVRFAISPQMRTMYEQRFGRKFYLLPPVVPAELVDLPFERQPVADRRGAIIGNAWSPEWIEHVVHAVDGSGVELDWFCNNPQLSWVGTNRQRLAEVGIVVREPLWGDDLVAELRRRPFLLVPTGMPTDQKARAIARLSLPSRAVFHLAAIRTPIVVVGDPSTAVADFVRRFGLGEVASYEPQSLREVVGAVSSGAMSRQIRATCDHLAPRFVATGVEPWLWRSMELGRPADERFEELWPPEDGLSDYVAPDPPRGMYWARHAAWQMLSRYARNGGRPRTVVDVGASTGLWSEMAASVFPHGHFVLCEPLFRRYPESQRRWYVDALPSHEVVDQVVTNRCGQTTLLVSDSLYGSSLLSVDQVHGETARVHIPCTTIDALDRSRNWGAPILLKADVQFAEHLVLEGAADTLRAKIDAVFLELSLTRGHDDARTYAEICAQMTSLGFELFDEADGWRDPRTARLEQKDVLFVRKR
jgi:FkbM family methyltransferase